jgi:hypothetical protein
VALTAEAVDNRAAIATKVNPSWPSAGFAATARAESPSVLSSANGMFVMTPAATSTTTTMARVSASRSENRIIMPRRGVPSATLRKMLYMSVLSRGRLISSDSMTDNR